MIRAVVAHFDRLRSRKAFFRRGQGLPLSGNRHSPSIKLHEGHGLLLGGHGLVAGCQALDPYGPRCLKLRLEAPIQEEPIAGH
jgi:hypothetical protein